MLKAEEVESTIGHPVGGVCPFGINDGIDVFLDDSLKRFESVYPSSFEFCIVDLCITGSNNQNTFIRSF
jgi:hypothetical protein